VRCRFDKNTKPLPQSSGVVAADDDWNWKK
jgi:hypothetical protein